MRYVIGIDPGQNGGIAFVAKRDLQLAEAYRYPKDIVGAANIVRGFVEEHGLADLAVIEKVGAMPKQGIASAYTFGTNVGSWKGILAALGIPWIEVTPTKWQKTAWDSAERKRKKTKELSLGLARRLWPNINMEYKADDGKADALHMARFGILYLRGGVK